MWNGQRETIGHARMSENRMVKTVYQCSVVGVPGRGRPPMMWEHRFEQYITE